MLRSILFLSVALAGCTTRGGEAEERATELDPAAVCLKGRVPITCLIDGSIHACDEDRCFRLTTVLQPIAQFPLVLTPIAGTQ